MKSASASSWSFQKKKSFASHVIIAAERQLWRALSLVIKAKMEACESNITDFEREFLAHIVMPDGKTVGEHVIPVMEQAYLSGHTPQLLLGSGE